MKNNNLLSISSRIVATIVLLLFLLPKPAKASVYYWVGGTGNWSQFNTHWATTSGDSVYHLQTPTPTDTVVFDANSFATTGDTVYVDSTLITCHSMIWTNVTNHPVFINQYYSPNNIFNIYGSITLSPNMTWLYGHNSGTIYFEATSGVNTITSASQTLGNLTFEGIGGAWSLVDSLTVNSGIYGQGISITSGIFRTNNQKVNASPIFQVSSTPTPTSTAVYLGTSTINCGDWRMYNGILDADSSIFICNDPAESEFDAGTNYIYHNVTE